MKSKVSYNLRRMVAAIIVSVVALLVIIPLLYDWVGTHSNLEDAPEPPQTPVVVVVPNGVVRTDVPLATLLPPATPSAVPPVPRDPNGINGVPLQRIAVISSAARAHIREVYALGQSLGRNPHNLSKIGDSTMVYPAFLAAFDNTGYRLGKYSYLQPTVSYMTGSFARSSAAVKKGMHTWSEFDPTWVASTLCDPNEAPIACEIRLNNPSIAIIRLGANDIDVPDLYEHNLGLIINYCLTHGVIPIVGTKPDRTDGPSNLINNIIRKTASAYSIPLWDYDLVAGTVPGRGLQPDQLHMLAGGTHDFTSPVAMTQGDSLEDLTGLIVLDAVRREINPETLK